MSKFQKVTNAELKETVNKELAQIAPNGEVVVAGLRLVMNSETKKKDSIEVEFIQERVLTSGASNGDLMGALNAGDSRFDRGQKVRVWYPITKAGAVKVLGWKEELVDSILSEAKDLAEDQRLAVMFATPTGNANGKEIKLKLIVNETTNVDTLPKAIRNQIGTEYEDRYILQAPVEGKTGEYEPVVDSEGSTIYRYSFLADDSIEDKLISGKKRLSDFVASNDGSSSNSMVSNLQGTLAK